MKKSRFWDVHLDLRPYKAVAYHSLRLYPIITYVIQSVLQC